MQFTWPVVSVSMPPAPDRGEITGPIIIISIIKEAAILTYFVKLMRAAAVCGGEDDYQRDKLPSRTTHTCTSTFNVVNGVKKYFFALAQISHSVAL